MTSESRSGLSTRRSARGLILHACRVAVFLAVIWLIRQQHSWYQAQQAGRDAATVTIEQVQRFLPRATDLADWSLERGGRTVVDENGNRLGSIVQTSPSSDHIVGYSGPTNMLLALDRDSRILGVEILSSGDTPEHVDDVLTDEQFLSGMQGLTWDEAGEMRDVDGVSGATLTSLAIIESIRFRLAGTKPSLRFPDPVRLSEVQQFFPQAAELRTRESPAAISDVFDGAGRRLGAALRTSPAADDEMGYQGPTDTLIALDPQDRVRDLVIRHSYDNEPYVGYVRDDDYFRSLFAGMSLEQLAALDPRAAEVEGVSGATMTSMAIAYGLPKAARAARVTAPPHRRALIVAPRDVGTLLVLGVALLMSFFGRWRARRWARLGFQVGLVVYLGLLNGDMVSQALLVGWAQSGVPWRLAPGLALLSAAALAVPVVSKKQLYCHHVCPYGAMQQLIRNRLPRRVRLGRYGSCLLQLIPAGLLLLVVLTAMLHWQVNLAGIEPFDAFVFWIAGAAAITVAVAGLIAASLVPMAYCRFGCPTGALLGYLRYHARSDRFSRRDLVAMVLLATAAAIYFLT